MVYDEQHAAGMGNTWNAAGAGNAQQAVSVERRPAYSTRQGTGNARWTVCGRRGKCTARGGFQTARDKRRAVGARNIRRAVSAADVQRAMRGGRGECMERGRGLALRSGRFGELDLPFMHFLGKRFYNGNGRIS
ncbi:MAG: hypothetical protein DBX55_09460 [Verrucomicrobia bacterium]|nr:MAG: hypothetical protein DBX55_09460 [Verrucomicrobiota bacterium]